MPRTIPLRQWLNHFLSSQYPDQESLIVPASADASFRRYFRVSLPDGATRIVKDALPEHEDCRPFLKVASLFREGGVHVPVVYAENLEQGFLLVSNLGITTSLEALND